MPLRIGITNEGITPSNTVHTTSVRMFDAMSAEPGTRFGAPCRIGVTTSRATIPLTGRSRGTLESAVIPYFDG